MLVIHYKEKENSQLLYLQQDLAKDDVEDPTVFLTLRVYIANVGNLDQFVFSTQFDIKELETYAKAI